MGIFLAPMAGVTDLPFRLLAKEFGADLVVSEMISAQAVVFENERTWRMLVIDPRERPVAIQLFGHNPKVMGEAARRVVSFCRPEMIDLNFGCPTPKIVRNGDGAALLNTPQLMGEIARAVVEAVPVPVTAKIRLGWDQENINCLETGDILEKSGIHWITLHARTADQFYSGKADWTWIARLKKGSAIPIVGNGDVFSARDGEALLAETACDHIAVGRGAQGNPWIFSQIKRLLQLGSELSGPSWSERVRVALRHLELKKQYHGEKRAVREMRSHLAWYLKGAPRAGQLRQAVNKAASFSEMQALLKSLL